jgi:hypothetical protein
VQLAAAAAAAAALPPLADISAACQFLRLPIRFDSQAAEVNAMALLHLLDFGSGFDPLLLPKTGRDAHEAVQFGLLGMLMHGAPLESRAWLAAFGGDQAFQFFGIDATEDEPVPGLPGVVMTRQGPLGAFTAQLREAMAQTGAALAAAGGRSCRGTLGVHWGHPWPGRPAVLLLCKPWLAPPPGSALLLFLKRCLRASQGSCLLSSFIATHPCRPTARLTRIECCRPAQPGGARAGHAGCPGGGGAGPLGCGAGGGSS